MPHDIHQDAVLDRVLTDAGIRPTTVESRARLDGATYNSAYRIRLRSGAGLVLKIAPDPRRPALRHEHHLTGTEATFYRTAAGVVPVPDVVHADLSRTVLDRDFLLMTELPGVSWHSVRHRVGGAERARLRTELGGTVAALHRIQGTGFGYPQDQLAPRWRTAFLGMLDAVLADAGRFAAPLPLPATEIHAVLGARADALDAVRAPVLVHFDLWAGNIMLGPHGITGFVDGERAFWGDPLAELVSLALFGDIERDSAFLAGYRGAGGALAFDTAARHRLAMYRCYLYLIMLVERVPRGHTGREHEALARLVGRHLRGALATLRGEEAA